MLTGMRVHALSTPWGVAGPSTSAGKRRKPGDSGAFVCRDQREVPSRHGAPPMLPDVGKRSLRQSKRLTSAD